MKEVTILMETKFKQKEQKEQKELHFDGLINIWKVSNHYKKSTGEVSAEYHVY